MASVDVVIPCYNYGHFLRSCVSSVLSQAGVEVRALVIDDQSSDSSQAVGEELAAADPRVHFRRHAVNRGHIATYNEGLLEWASADYCLLLSADDLLVPGALARATALMEASPEVGMVYGAALFFSDEASLVLPPDYDQAEHRVIPSDRFLEFCCLGGNPVPTPTALVRTQLQHRIGGYRPSLPHAGDMEMWMRCATQAPIGVLRSVQALYRWHGANMSRAYFGRMLSERSQQLLAGASVLAEHPSFPQAASWLENQRRRLSHEALWWASGAIESGDQATVRECLEFARTHHPDLHGSSVYWRFLLKRMLGRRTLAGVRAAMNRLRGRDNVSADELASFDSIRPGSRTGWWPEGNI